MGLGDEIVAPTGDPGRVLVDGTWNTEILDELAPEPGDRVVLKHRYSGFFETDLDEILGKARRELPGGHRLYDQRLRRVDGAKEQNNNCEIIGTHPSINKMKELISKIANGSMPILINGELGTGKGFIANYIHQSREREIEKFFTINCSFYSEEILEGELFGHENNGEHIPGKLELADGGTLFLEEIHSLPLLTQIKLLKFINDKLIFRQGKYYEVHVRIISSTDKNLPMLIKEGLFRQDLYYKLSIIPISIPPLHKRKQDILSFAMHFLQKLNCKSNTHNKVFDNHVKDIFLAYNWPGNIQELANVIEYAHNFEATSIITEASLPEYLLEETRDKVQLNHQKFNLQQIEQETIKRALIEIERTGGKKEDAALLLGIGRATLFRKINEFQL